MLVLLSQLLTFLLHHLNCGVVEMWSGKQWHIVGGQGRPWAWAQNSEGVELGIPMQALASVGVPTLVKVAEKPRV